MRVRSVVIVSLVLAAAGGAVAWKLRARAPEGVDVETEAASRRTIVQTVTSTGRIQPKTQVSISADVSAKITRLEVKEGDWVEKGRLLLELDRERYQAELEVAEANLKRALSNATLALENRHKAEKDYERARGLHDRRLESQAQHDSVWAALQAEKARHQAALDQVEESRAALKQAQDALGKTRIFAPLAGTVSKLDKEVGEMALGAQFQSDVIMEISNLRGMEAVVDVDENDIVSVKAGDRASIEVDALPGVQLRGEVAEIANSAKTSGSGTQDQKTEFEVKVTVLDANPQLRPGMTASATITTQTKGEVIGVPLQAVAVRTLEQLKGGVEPALAKELEGALRPDKQGFVELVFVVQDGRARARQVKTGIQSETHIEVLEGLEEGESLVAGSYRAISKDLQHGTLVRAKPRGAEASALAQR